MARQSHASVPAAFALTAALAVWAVPSGGVRAEFIATDRIVERQAMQDERARVSGFLAREDVRQQLTEMGIDADEASKRVGSMSDAELAQIADRIDALPAGQRVGRGTLVLVLLLVVIVLLLV